MIKAIIRKLSYEFDLDSPEQRLMFAVISTAINDLKDTRYRAECIRYLNHDLSHAEMCGVDPDWIRSICYKANLFNKP